MWTVGRVMLVALSRPEKVGEFFGLFSLAGKVSAVFGPALTAVLLFVFGGGPVGYRISIGSLAVIMAAGLFFLLRVPDARPEGRIEEFAPLIRRPRERKMYAVKGNILRQSRLAALR
jgi:UMF1 family MFS transporter